MALRARVAAPRAVRKRAERHAVVELDPVAEAAGFPDHDAGTVIDEEVIADLGSRVNVDPGLAVGVPRHDARDDLLAHLVEAMRQPIGRNRDDARVGGDDLSVARRGRIPLIGGFEIRGYQVANGRECLDQLGGALATNQGGDEAVDHAQVTGELAGGRIVGDDRPQCAQRVGDTSLVGKDLLSGLREGVAVLALCRQLVRDESNFIHHGGLQ